MEAQRRCTECGVELTEAEIEAAVETDGPFLCTVHASEEVDLDESDGVPPDD